MLGVTLVVRTSCDAAALQEPRNAIAADPVIVSEELLRLLPEGRRLPELVNDPGHMRGYRHCELRTIRRPAQPGKTRRSPRQAKSRLARAFWKLRSEVPRGRRRRKGQAESTPHSLIHRSGVWRRRPALPRAVASLAPAILMTARFARCVPGGNT